MGKWSHHATWISSNDTNINHRAKWIQMASRLDKLEIRCGEMLQDSYPMFASSQAGADCPCNLYRSKDQREIWSAAELWDRHSIFDDREGPMKWYMHMQAWYPYITFAWGERESELVTLHACYLTGLLARAVSASTGHPHVQPSYVSVARMGLQCKQLSTTCYLAELDPSGAGPVRTRPDPYESSFKICSKRQTWGVHRRGSSWQRPRPLAL